MPVLNVETTIGAQLDALARQTFDRPYEVIVADNGSSDATREIVESRRTAFEALRLVDASARRGANYARNVGADAASSELLLFCDGDDVVDEGWVAAMFDALIRGDAVGGAISRFDRVREEWGAPEVPERLRVARPLRSPIGACCAVRRSVFAALGGFDEALQANAGDETEFFWRLQLAGYSLIEAPEAWIRYRDSASFITVLRKTYRSARGRVLLMKRFEMDGGQARTAIAELRAWGALFAGIPRAALVPVERRPFMRKVAKAAGRNAGHVRFRHEQPVDVTRPRART